MADIKQAAKWMQKGERVRMRSWQADIYWLMKRGVVFTAFGQLPALLDEHLLADEWEIYTGA